MQKIEKSRKNTARMIPKFINYGTALKRVFTAIFKPSFLFITLSGLKTRNRRRILNNLKVADPKREKIEKITIVKSKTFQPDFR